MESSDEEGEILPECVTNYRFLNENKESVPFTVLPLQWSQCVTSGTLKEQILLCGNVDDGLETFHRYATAWKFELSGVHPDISILTKNKVWLKLLTPAKTYEELVRTILIAVNYLHLVKKNPDISRETMWNDLQKIFSFCDTKPSENDLMEHRELICHAAILDADFVKSKLLLNFLLRNPGEEIISQKEIPVEENLKMIQDKDDYDKESHVSFHPRKLTCIGDEDDYMENSHEEIESKQDLKAVELGREYEYDKRSHEDIQEQKNLTFTGDKGFCAENSNVDIKEQENLKFMDNRDDYCEKHQKDIQVKESLKFLKSEEDYDEISHEICDNIEQKETLKVVERVAGYDEKSYENIRHDATLKDIEDHNDSDEKCREDIQTKEKVEVQRDEEDFDRKSPEDTEENESMKGMEDAYDDVDDEWCKVLLYEHVCSICDNGGNILCCEGRCMRSFHATKEDGLESSCESLGFSAVQVHAMKNFLCKNCQHQQHQCFVCGMLGSSDTASGAEVFPCVSATCGHFFHPHCVAKVINPGNEAQVKELKNRIAKGESFTCPAHKCFICKKGEDKSVHDLQFAVCRRCPKSYHRKCLPKKIRFESIECHKRRPQRAWNDLIPNRILIYCMEHKIVPGLWTPERNHIVFPDLEVRKTKKLSQLGDVMKVSEAKTLKEMPKQVKVGDSSERTEEIRRQGSDMKNSRTDLRTKILDKVIKSGSVKDHVSAASGSRLSIKSDLQSFRPGEGFHRFKARQHQMSRTFTERENFGKPALTSRSSVPTVDYEIEKQINTLIEKANASFDNENFRKKQRVSDMHAPCFKRGLDKIILSGRVEVSVNAARDALLKLKGGYRVQEAKAVCEPQMLTQIVRWKKMLKVYLAPFLHGNRYTSYGRHFTQVRKLQEIVDRLHLYVQNGDTIVDFCCGANDFSCLMKEKLDKMGKMCSFRNYDLIPPKKDFCFENRDWMTIHPDELPGGSQLIMGLNPPFGVNASLANKFINKALEFKPKLLILIVPKETDRLDEKRCGYDLIWEDTTILSGKSFYLPGSIDIHEKQLEQWNNDPPPLYLWSRPDWTTRHKEVACEHGHFFGDGGKLYKLRPQEDSYLFEGQRDVHFKRNNLEPVSVYQIEKKHVHYESHSPVVQPGVDPSTFVDYPPDEPPSEGVNDSVLNDENPSENNMIEDMELASPVSSNGVQEKSQGFPDKPNEVIDMLEMEARGMDKWVKNPLPSKINLGFLKNYAQIHEQIESNCGLRNEEACPSGTETGASSHGQKLSLKRKYIPSVIVNPMQSEKSSKWKPTGADDRENNSGSKIQSLPGRNATSISLSGDKLLTKRKLLSSVIVNPMRTEALESSSKEGIRETETMDSGSVLEKERTSDWTVTSATLPGQQLHRKRKRDSTEIANPVHKEDSHILSKDEKKGDRSINPVQSKSTSSTKKEEPPQCKTPSNSELNLHGQPTVSFPYYTASHYYAQSGLYHQQQDYYGALYQGSLGYDSQAAQFPGTLYGYPGSTILAPAYSAYGYPGSTFLQPGYEIPWINHFTSPESQYADDVPPVPGLPDSLDYQTQY